MKGKTSKYSKTCKNHIANFLAWKKILLSNFSERKRANPLIQYIRSKVKQLIVTDGSKSKKFLGWAWIVATETSTEIMTGFNPDFEMVDDIHSHRAETFGVLTIFLFLEEYCKYFFIELASPIEFYCDNEVVISKLNQLIIGINHFYEKHKTIDLDAVLKLKECMPRFLKVFHVKGHQDNKRNHSFKIPE